MSGDEVNEEAPICAIYSPLYFFRLVLIRQPNYSAYRLIVYVVPHATILVISEMLHISQEIHLLVKELPGKV
jgi:hypothetical protein